MQEKKKKKRKRAWELYVGCMQYKRRAINGIRTDVHKASLTGCTVNDCEEATRQ